MRNRLFLTLAAMMATVPAFAQGQTTAPQPGVTGRVETINAATDIGIDQRLNAQVPLDTLFRNEDGQVVPLSTYFGKRPVWVVMPFYRCKGTCTQMLNGIVDTIQQPNLNHKIGQDFDVVVISIDPRETADLANAKKRQYISELGIPGAEVGWHFLTGEEANIQKVAGSIGYRYTFNAKNGQYAHPSGTFILTPEGKISRYFYGVVYPPKDVRLSLTEARQGKIGSLRDLKEAMILGCYDYDPKRGRYGFAVLRVIQILGMATVLLMGSFIAVNVRKDVRSGKALPQGTAGAQSGTPGGEA